jgi:hypothetical protein
MLMLSFRSVVILPRQARLVTFNCLSRLSSKILTEPHISDYPVQVLYFEQCALYVAWGQLGHLELTF